MDSEALYIKVCNKICSWLAGKVIKASDGGEIIIHYKSNLADYWIESYVTNFLSPYVKLEMTTDIGCLIDFHIEKSFIYDLANNDCLFDDVIKIEFGDPQSLTFLLREMTIGESVLESI